MKKCFFSIALLIVSAITTAQSIHTFKVIDSLTKEPIAQATIQLDKSGDFQTNEMGEFKLKTIPPKLTISHVGYKTKTLVNVQPSETLILLAQSSNLMQAIEIKSVRAGKNYPFTQTLISKSELAKNNVGQDIPFLLNQVPGTVINSDAGNGIGYTGIRIRGTDATRINVTLNGIPYNDAESQGVYFVDLPDIVSSTGSIQVQRGVGTSSNGTGAFGATINLQTNEVNEKRYADVNNSYGSFNSRKNTFQFGSGLIKKRYTIDLRLSQIHSDGYIERAKSNISSYYISTAIIKEKSSLRLNIFSGKEKTYQAWNGVEESQLEINRRYNSAGTERTGTPYENQTDNYRQTHFQIFYNKKINASWNFNAAGFLTHGKGYYEEYHAQNNFSDYGLPDIKINNQLITKTDLVRQLWLDNNFYGTTFAFQSKNEKREIIIGGGNSIYEGNHFGKVIWIQYLTYDPLNHKWYDLDARKTEQNAYMKVLRNLGDKTYFFYDLQLRNVAYNIGGFRYNPSLFIDKKWLFVNPKIGFKKSIDNMTFFASYAMANKEPNRDDFEAGKNEMPKNETLHDFETGIEKNSPTMKLSATGYFMAYKNQLVLTGKINDVGAYTRSNIDKSYRTGVELEANVKLSDHLRFNNNLALSQNKIINFTDYIDDYDNGGQKPKLYKKSDIGFSPNVVGSSSFSYSIAKGFEAALISKYVGRQYLDNTSRIDRSLAAYFLQDFKLNYQFNMRKICKVEMIFQLNNIWNKMYTPNGYTYSYIYGGETSRNNYYYPMAGTNFMLGLNLHF